MNNYIFMYALAMLNARDTLLALDRLDNPPPSTTDFERYEVDDQGIEHVIEFDEQTYDAAWDHWQERGNERAEAIHEADTAGELPSSSDGAVMSVVARASTRVKEAEIRRSKVLAFAVHTTQLSTRAVANVAGLHPRTVEKRANDPVALKAIIEFKEQELQTLRTMAQAEEDQTSEGKD